MTADIKNKLGSLKDVPAQKYEQVCRVDNSDSRASKKTGEQGGKSRNECELGVKGWQGIDSSKSIHTWVKGMILLS